VTTRNTNLWEIFLNADIVLVYLTVLKQSTMKRNAMALQETNHVIPNMDRDLNNRAKNK
jgi:hypothetical protein